MNIQNYYLTTLLFILLLLSGCFKDTMPVQPEIDPVPNENQVIVTNLPGSYTWIKSVHPSTNDVTTPATNNYTERLEVTSTNFQLYRDGALVDEFPYVTQRTSADENNTTYRIINADGGSERYTFNFTSNSRLFLSESCCQRLRIEYQRN